MDLQRHSSRTRTSSSLTTKPLIGSSPEKLTLKKSKQRGNGHLKRNVDGKKRTPKISTKLISDLPVEEP
jgi:hypothetical protein